jgi:transcription elongation factor/antiterminator RfaH
MTVSNSRRWYVVQTRPKQEADANRQLRRQGFRTFLPCRLKTRRHARKIETIRVSYFPGYIFVSLDLTRERWRSVKGTYGVARLISFGERPAPVPEGIIEGFLELMDDNGILSFHQELYVGQPVKILAGPFSQVIGKFLRLDDCGRIHALLDIMGRQVAMSLPKEYVSA